jgi:hypothetical protein
MSYLNEAVDEHMIREKIMFGQDLCKASFASNASQWSLETTAGQRCEHVCGAAAGCRSPRLQRCNFICSL